MKKYQILWMLLINNQMNFKKIQLEFRNKYQFKKNTYKKSNKKYSKQVDYLSCVYIYYLFLAGI